jgi:hypothetical protein
MGRVTRADAARARMGSARATTRRGFGQIAFAIVLLYLIVRR